LLIHIYRTCKFLSEFLGVEWKVVDLAEAYKKDRETWKNDYCMMHEMTLDKILADLQPVYFDILDAAKNLVINRQKDFWFRKDYILFTMCLNMRTENLRMES